MEIEVRLVKTIQYGLQLELSSGPARALLNFYRESKKKTLHLQQASPLEFKELLESRLDELRRQLEAGLDQGSFLIRLEAEKVQSAPARKQDPPWLIFTDGGASPNPGAGAYAWIVRDPEGRESEGSGFVESTTNNRMELLAVIEGLKMVPLESEIVVSSDSRYLQQGITSWITGWKRNGWKTAGGKPVLNRDLWETLDDLRRGRRIEWTWVKGHAGHPENERCDALVGLTRENRGPVKT